MAFMKDDATTSRTRVVCATWAQLILPDKGVYLSGSLFCSFEWRRGRESEHV